MYKDPKQLLHYILEECSVIEQTKTSGLTYEKLIGDEVIKRAIVKSLENIGEAGSKVPFEVRENWKEIKWKDVIGMRQRLAHDYWGINYDIVWSVVQTKIPELKIAIENILKTES
jgi:uncharacterized protein with HEPN domain